jgi:hypothetical protein
LRPLCPADAPDHAGARSVTLKGAGLVDKGFARNHTSGAICAFYLMFRPEQRQSRASFMLSTSEATFLIGICEMYGAITKFRPDLGVGIIRGENGSRYRFSKGALRNGLTRLEGDEVDFELTGLKARDIVVLAGSPWTALGAFSAQS